MSLDAVFLGRTDFCTTSLRIWYFLVHETYIHFVAQETRIIRKLFIFNCLHQKGRNRQKLYIFDYRTLIADFDLFNEKLKNK